MCMKYNAPKFFCLQFVGINPAIESERSFSIKVCYSWVQTIFLLKVSLYKVAVDFKLFVKNSICIGQTEQLK